MQRLRVRSLRWWVLASVVALSVAGAAQTVTARPLTAQQQLGRALFFDPALSIGGNQACANCHAPAAGFAGPNSHVNAAGAVYEGAIAGRFGNRKPPSVAYASLSPRLHTMLDEGESVVVGGNFYDGRATGKRLGSPAADQAQGPLVNPLEQALGSSACVVWRVCTSDERLPFQKLSHAVCSVDWPADAETRCSSGERFEFAAVDQKRVSRGYDDIARAIAAYESSREVNAFTSKFDAWRAGRAALTAQERRGLAVFRGKAECDSCHVLDAGPGRTPPVLTDFTYDNIGVPRNPDNPWYAESSLNPAGREWSDPVLGAVLKGHADYAKLAAENLGRHKVPSLRNVDKRPDPGFVKAYMHNGYFKTLEGVVDFYNTRDVKPRCADPFTREADALTQGCWPAPEVEATVNRDELGNLGLTPEDVAAVVAFMKTLSDGYQQ